MFLTYYVIPDVILLVFYFYVIFSIVYFGSLNCCAHFSFYFPLNMLCAFDHICMEKASYKFLIIIIMFKFTGTSTNTSSVYTEVKIWFRQVSHSLLKCKLLCRIVALKKRGN